MAFHQIRYASEKKYGVSAVRPQDMDRNMMVTARRNNLGIVAANPQDYSTKLILSSNVKLNLVTSFVGRKALPINEWVNLPMRTEEITANLASCEYIGIDFEFHNKDSYEGFICVTSLAAKNETFVVESLFGNRQSAINSIKNLLENTNVVKIFCGADNDLLRAKKDWNAFPVNVLDLQDLFVIWKIYNYSDCFQSCARAIQEKQLKPNSRPMNDFEINEFLRSYTKPSLEFLVRAVLNQPMDKNKLATLADYRRRPLHPDLIEYSGLDARYAFEIFESIARKVTVAGIQMAITMSSKILLNYSSPPSHKSLRLFTTNMFGIQIQKWREYLSKNLDKNPDMLISNQNVQDLIHQLQNNISLIQDEDALSRILENYKIHDNFTKAARLLIAYLDHDQTQLIRMKSIFCNRCNKMGHTAFFCCTILMTNVDIQTAKEGIRTRGEIMGHQAKQSKRRWENYCRNRNLNPETAVKPWIKAE